jgi:hypothetical protein
VGKLIGEGSFDCAQVCTEKRTRIKMIKSELLVDAENIGGVECILGFLYE